MDVNTTEAILRLVSLIEKAIEAEKTVTIKVDEITIGASESTASGVEVTME